jgi:hypothetical protein
MLGLSGRRCFGASVSYDHALELGIREWDEEETYPTATPFKKTHCSCACSGFFSAYFGFEGYLILLPFNK